MPDDDKLLPSLGALPAARDALDLVGMAAGLGDTDLERYETVDDDLIDLIVALTKLASLLLTAAVGRSDDRAAQRRSLLGRIRLDQELRAARAELDDLDGSPAW